MPNYAQQYRAALVNVQKFRWMHQGYGRLVRPSCGAMASEDYLPHTIKRIDSCSPSCPWRVAEELLEETAETPIGSDA